jgi:hypothetical protein
MSVFAKEPITHIGFLHCAAKHRVHKCHAKCCLSYPISRGTHKILMKLSGLPEERLAILGACGGAIALAELVDLSREN